MVDKASVALSPTRAWWTALGGRNALTVWSWVLPTFAAVAYAVAFEVPQFGYRPLPRVALVVAVQLLLIPLLLVGHRLLARPGPPRPLLGLLIFIALGLARGFAVYLLAPHIEPIARNSLAYQVSLNITYALLTLPFIAMVVDAVRRFRELRATVISEGLRWERALDDAEQEFAAELARFREKVHSEVIARVVHLQDELAATAREAAGAGASAGAEDLRRLSAEVVRPLSHELILEPTNVRVVPAPFVAPPSRPGIREVVRDAARAPAAGHWAVCAVMALLGLVGLSSYGSAVLVVLNLGWDLVIFGVVPAAADQLTRRTWPRLPVLGGWIASAALWSLLGAIGVLGTAALMRVTLGAGVVFWGAAVAYVALSALSVIALAGFRRQLELEIEFHDVLARREALASRLMQRIDHQRRELGFVLHGLVQASLTRAAMALEEWGETRDADSLPAVIDEVREALQSVAGALDAGDSVAVGLDLVVRDRLRLWEGAVDCRSFISVDAVSAADGALAKRVGDVVGEAITNAVRHGQAEAVDIDVALAGDWLVVTVRDDGRGPVDARHPGAGLGSLGRAGISWNLERVNAGTVLTVRIPVPGVLETEQGTPIVPILP